MSKLPDKIKDCINRDDVECLKGIVKTKKDANYYISSQSTSPLWYAIIKRAKKSAEFLINKGADVNYRPSDSELRALAGLISVGWFDLVQNVIKNKLPITKDTLVESLQEAMRQQDAGQIEQITHLIASLVKHVVKSGDTLTQYLGPENSNIVLRTSVLSSNFELFKHLINTYNFDVKGFTDKEKNSLLHLAATSINLDKVKYLVEEKGIPVSVANKKLETPLHKLFETLVNLEPGGRPKALTQVVDIIKYLIDKNADLEALTAGGLTPVGLLMKLSTIAFPLQAVREPGYLTEKVRTIASLLRSLMQQNKLSKEELDEYTSYAYKTITHQLLQRHKKLQYELLTLPIRSLLPYFLERRLTELCEGKN